MIVRDQHSSLFDRSVSDDKQKKFNNNDTKVLVTIAIGIGSISLVMLELLASAND